MVSLPHLHSPGLKADVKEALASAGDAQAPPEPLDLTHPLSHYFISSSHNTYLLGNQLYGKATAAAYQQVLEQGCRCVEIDIWDGEEDSSSESSSDEEPAPRRPDAHPERVSKWRADRVEPRVLHGHTATKECSFRAVCETIGLYAFTKSDLPLIISLEVHTCHQQQELMVEIMHEYWRKYLVDVAGASEKTALPPLETLRNKILIKVKYSAPQAEKATDSVTLTTTTSGDSSGDESQAVSEFKGKIIPALGSMGVYTRSHHFTSLDQPEASLPTHIFSMSEGKFSSVHAKDPKKFFAHNMSYLLRAYPKGTRVSSSNLDPAPFWRQGAQIVALNWQYINEGMMLNRAMFDGTGGYVLKPAGFWHPQPQPSSSTDSSKPPPPTIPTTAAVAVPAIQRGRLDLTIELLAGQNLGPPHREKKLKAYVKTELHLEQESERQAAGLPAGGAAKDGEYKHKTPTAGSAGRDADFKGSRAQFLGVRHVTEELSFVRFKVLSDDNFAKDEMVNWACIRVKRLQEGVRVVHLFDRAGKPAEGRLLVKVTKTFTPA